MDDRPVVNAKSYLIVVDFQGVEMGGYLRPVRVGELLKSGVVQVVGVIPKRVQHLGNQVPVVRIGQPIYVGPGWLELAEGVLQLITRGRLLEMPEADVVFVLEQSEDARRYAYP